jgi:hypothetical protein
VRRPSYVVGFVALIRSVHNKAKNTPYLKMSLRTRNLTVVRLGGPAPSENRWVEPVNHSGIRKFAWMGQRARKTGLIERYLATAKRGFFDRRLSVRLSHKQASLHTVRGLKRCIGHRTPLISVASLMPSFRRTLLSSTQTTQAMYESTESPCGRKSLFHPLGLAPQPHRRGECPRTTVARRPDRQYSSDPSPSGRRFVQGARLGPSRFARPWSPPKAQQPLLLQWKALLCKQWRASNGKAQVYGLSKLLTQLPKAPSSPLTAIVRRKSVTSSVRRPLLPLSRR